MENWMLWLLFFTMGLNLYAAYRSHQAKKQVYQIAKRLRILAKELESQIERRKI